MRQEGTAIFDIQIKSDWLLICFVLVISKPDHPPSPGNFFDGRIPHPPGKKELKTPTPGL